MKIFMIIHILKKKGVSMKRITCMVLGAVFYSFSLFAADYPIKQIEAELSQAEKDLQIAKKMFNPWYGGPLLTGSGNVMPPGYVNIGAQLQLTDYYASYNGSGKSVPADSIVEANPSLSLGFGLVSRVDLNIGLGWDYQYQLGEKYFGWQDVSAKLAFSLAKEGSYMPAVKFSIKEVFPAGKYKNLDPQKASVQGLGDGAYKTEFGLNFSKVVWWSLIHPMQLRLSLNYGIASEIKVKNFNSYGGGFGTDGKVDYGNYFKSSFGYELSITQKVVWAIDLAYEYSGKKTFRGIYGTSAQGTQAAVGGPSGYRVSLAPAIEYNFTPDIALISGVWFAVCGRNKSDFIAGIVSFSAGF